MEDQPKEKKEMTINELKKIVDALAENFGTYKVEIKTGYKTYKPIASIKIDMVEKALRIADKDNG